ncbi:MAG: gamma-glutamyltransferase family protein [Candidatus Abyssubacteria bacterium]
MKYVKISASVIIGLTVMLFLVYLVLPKGPEELMEFDDPCQVPRESVRAESHMAATGTPWATEAALKILDQGGNAFDAGMAALLALNVTYPEAASFPSVAPTIIYDAAKGEIWSYCGVGTAPAKATIEFFRSKGHETIPSMGILAQLVPSSPDAIVAILDKYGTMSFGQISEDAIRLASDGFPVHRMMLNHLDLSLVERVGFRVLMPYNSEVYLKGQWWRTLHHKERFRQPDLAKTLRAMAQAEEQVVRDGGDRSEGLQAVRDYFYEGPIADAIVKLHEEEGGLITRKDLADYAGYWEKPLTGEYHGYTLHANQTWNQGAVVPLALQILSGIDLKSMGHQSPEYIHTLIQAIDLAIADREAYFGDPAFVTPPMEALLSMEYAALRRNAMTPGKAFGRMPPAGDPSKSIDKQNGKTTDIAVMTPRIGRALDTSYLAVVDRWGNSISLTPSDFPQSPMVPGTGLCLGIRMTQFRLDPTHPSSLAPGKRPRITPNASMVTRDGEWFMTFGTPEGDQQPQALVQVFLNLTVFGMDIQDAIDAPRFRSRNFPDSFSPHEYTPGVVELEKGLHDKVGKELETMGYKVKVVPDWHYEMGAVCAILRDGQDGTLVGGADPRQENWAAGR